MSDDYLRIIPTDPVWAPTRSAAATAVTYVVSLYEDQTSSVDEVAAEFHDAVEFIDSGVNTSTVSCPSCGQTREIDWIFDIVGERHPDLTDLNVHMPCCGEVNSMNELEYDWPIGFARFEIAILNGTRPRYDLDAAELGRVQTLLGHPVRQVLAHY